jgi:hypothetical protein
MMWATRIATALLVLLALAASAEPARIAPVGRDGTGGQPALSR